MNYNSFLGLIITSSWLPWARTNDLFQRGVGICWNQAQNLRHMCCCSSLSGYLRQYPSCEICYIIMSGEKCRKLATSAFYAAGKQQRFCHLTKENHIFKNRQMNDSKSEHSWNIEHLPVTIVGSNANGLMMRNYEQFMSRYKHTWNKTDFCILKLFLLQLQISIHY